LNEILNIIFLDRSRIKEIDHFLKLWNDPNDFIVVHSSGSTGPPKEIRIKKSAMRNSALRTIEFFNLKKEDVLYSCLSCSTIAGTMMMVRALVGNQKIIIGPVSIDSLKYLEEPVSFVAMIPAQVEGMITNFPEKAYLFKKVLLGGGVISKELNTKIDHLKEVGFFQSYGMTETISHIAIRSLAEHPENTYLLLEGVSIGVDERGCLWLNDEVTNSGIIQTNDIVEILSSTSFKWIGRWDNVINSGGKKFFTEELEKKISSLVNAPFFIGPIPHKIWGEQITLFTTDKKLVISKGNLGKVLDDHEIPKEIRVLNEFIFTRNHKINRSESVNQPAIAIKEIL